MLDQFIANIKNGGLSRSNRYVVNIAKPFAVDDVIYRQILLYCDQAQLPGVNYSTIQNRSYGEFREVPYEKLYGDVNMSFYVDKDLYVKEFFDKWINSIQDTNSRAFNYYDQYTTKISIDVQDLNDNSKYRVTLHECYPKTISPIQLDYSAKDVMKMQVVMQFKYWESFLINSTSANMDTSASVDAFEQYTYNWSTYQETAQLLLQETYRTAGAGVQDAEDLFGVINSEKDW
jgi:hypothetical protein